MFLKSNRRSALCLAALAFALSAAPLGLFNSYNPYGFRSESQYVEQLEQMHGIGNLINSSNGHADIGDLIGALDDPHLLPGISWQMAKPRGIEHFDGEAISYGYMPNTLKVSVPVTEPLPDYDTEALTELMANL